MRETLVGKSDMVYDMVDDVGSTCVLGADDMLCFAEVL